jgi:hypothetical protein
MKIMEANCRRMFFDGEMGLLRDGAMRPRDAWI